MIDQYGRNIHYLRVSVTDRCNLRCRYCMPEEGVESYTHDEILRYDEITRVVQVMAGLGVDRIRITGGEPLVRKGLMGLIQQIHGIGAIRFIGITTNGLLLKDMAYDLCRAGVGGVNISLDTTNAKRFAEITRRDQFDAVIAGIESVLALPFQSIKVNCVLSPDSQDEDWLGVIALAKKWPIDVRLIEWMPMQGEQAAQAIRFSEALSAIIAHFGPLQPLRSEICGGPARYWKAEGFKGRIGFIHAMSNGFCDACNRIRLTSTGDLKLCLFYDTGISLMPLLRNGTSDGELQHAIREALAKKPRKHQGQILPYEDIGCAQQIKRAGGMYRTGG